MAQISRPDIVNVTEDRKAFEAEVKQRKQDVKDFVTLFPVWRVWMISYIRDLREIAYDIYSIHKPGTRVGVGQSVAGGADNTAACDTDIVTQTQRRKRVNDIIEQYTKDSREMAECYMKLSRAVRILKRYGKKSETTFPGGAESLTEHLAGFAAVAETISKQETVTSKAGSAAQTRLPFILSLISRANNVNLNRGARADIAKHIHGVAEVLEDEVMAYKEVYKHLEGTATISMYSTAEAGFSDVIFMVGAGR
uniref:Uncharacterized LOC103190599 n=1 Tax=Callorhinchus milii TaxID=7868 RepID=A0A4W3JA30_CALMI